MLGFCPHCERESSLDFVKTIEEINIRGEIIPVETEFFRCLTCGEEFERILPGQDIDPLEKAYREYRRCKGMLQPEEIQKFREKYGLSQKDLSDLLRIGVATLSRYENGALQEESHDRLLQMSMDPSILVRLVESNTRMNKEKRERLLHRLKDEEAPRFFLKAAIDYYGSYEPDIYSGYNRFNITKFTESIKFFCFHNEVFKTKLNKLLFYADFKAFKEYGVSISGVRYAHAPHGPVPDRYLNWFAAILSNEPSLEIHEVEINGVSGDVLTAIEQPDLSVFSPDEITVLAQINSYFSRYSATEIREFSHEEVGYQQTNDGELIPYHYANLLRI